MTNQVDAISIDKKTGLCTLAIIDSLDWENEEEHLLLLQEKLNVYLSFIEGGEIYTVYEPSKGREFEIKIYFQQASPESCKQFIEQASRIIFDAGFQLTFQNGID